MSEIVAQNPDAKRNEITYNDGTRHKLAVWAVQDLIEALQGCPPDMPVYRFDSKRGKNPIRLVSGPEPGRQYPIIVIR